MVQHLKEEVRESIIQAATTIFYEHSFSSATLRMIADQANLPVSNIYSYFENKAALFDAVVESVYACFHEAITSEEALFTEDLSALETFRITGQDHFLGLLENPKGLVILVDKSEGTRHAGAKDALIDSVELHIRRALALRKRKKYEDLLPHILASNFTESLIEIARHYTSRERAGELLGLVTQCYFQGVDSLL